MNISPLNFNGKFAHDDSVSEIRRNEIRKHIDEKYLYNVDIFLKSQRLEPDKLDKLIHSLVGDQQEIFRKRNLAPVEVGDIQEDEAVELDYDILKELPVYNAKPIYGTQSYRGGTACLNDRVCSILKKGGIKRIVCLCPYGLHRNNACKEYELETMEYSMKRWYQRPEFASREMVIEEADWKFNTYGPQEPYKTKEEARKYYLDYYEQSKREGINDFIKFINFMQKDNVYIGCECGTYDTDRALMLNDFFNPKAQNTPRAGCFADDVYLNAMIRLYNNLTPEDKAKLGWDEEFEKTFKDKINKAYEQYKIFCDRMYGDDSKYFCSII